MFKPCSSASIANFEYMYLSTGKLIIKQSIEPFCVNVPIYFDTFQYDAANGKH